MDQRAFMGVTIIVDPAQTSAKTKPAEPTRPQHQAAQGLFNRQASRWRRRLSRMPMLGILIATTKSPTHAIYNAGAFLEH